MIEATRLPIKSAAVSLVLYVALMGLILFWLVPQSGGRWPLDLRFPTYSVEDAAVYLHLLPPVGRDIYAGPVFWLDMVFPPVLGLTLALWGRNWGVQLWRVAPLAYVLADWSENFIIGRILAGLPDLPVVSLIQMASLATLGKYISLVCAVTLIVVTVLRERRNA